MTGKDSTAEKMAQSPDAALPVTLEVVVVALAPHLSLNTSASDANTTATTTTTTRHLLGGSLSHSPSPPSTSGSVSSSPGGVFAAVFPNVDVTLLNAGSPTYNSVFIGGDPGRDSSSSSSDSSYYTLGDELAAVEPASMVSVSYIALFSALFCVVGLVGMAGNVLVVYIVLKDRKMRKSVTNLLILNLAVADSLLMVFGVPEIVQFMLDRGWLLGLIACRVNRSVLVAALYASVLTLVAVCVER